jgi:hypothetical protein
MVSSTGRIRHADGGGIGRSLAVAATLHCTMNTWGFLPLFELFLLARLVLAHEQSGLGCASGPPERWVESHLTLP